MDISILLALQDFRNVIGSFLTDFMLKMTFLGEINTALVILAVVYWCISKQYGTYMLMGWCGSRYVNGVIKITACAYRPWIRDSRIVPHGNSINTATGYSFPSGHTTNAASIFGSMTVRKDMPAILHIVSACLIVLVALSRCFLGVHTPQDVVVGAISGLFMMWLSYKLMNWIDKNPQKDTLVLCVGIVIAVTIALYAIIKPYPTDYDADGKLLVDGAKMARDTLKSSGWGIGFFAGWLLERRFIGFSTDVSAMKRITRLVIGLFGFYVISLIILPLLKLVVPDTAYVLVSSFLQLFYISFLFPCSVKLVDRFSEQTGKVCQ